MPAGSRGWRLLARVREGWQVHVELQERLALADRPWEERFLHWAPADDGGWRLHGDVVPPADGRRRSTTRSGWCPGLRVRA